MSNFRLILKRVLYVSKLTNVKFKKLRIILSVVLANLIVSIDIFIIVTFSSLLTKSVDNQNLIVISILNMIKNNLILIPLIILLRYLIMFVDRMNMEILSLQVNENLRFYLMNEIFRKGNYSTADAFYYLNNVSQHVSSFYKALSGFLNNFLQIVGYSFFLIYSDVKLVSYFFIGGLFLILPTKYLLLKGKYFQHLSFNLGKEVSDYIQRILENIFLIKILNTSNREFVAFKSKLNQNKDAFIKNNVFGALNSMLPSFITLFVLGCIIAFSNFAKNLTIEFIGVLLRMFQSLGNFNNTLTLVVNSSVHVEELYKLELNLVPSKEQHYFLEPNLPNAIEISDVTFKYFGSNETIFKNLNLNIPKGKHTIITGPNGSGKSTLLGLLTGLYISEKGKVTCYSQKLGYVGVNPLIVSGTLRDNLIYGNSKEIENSVLTKITNEFSLFEKEKTNLNSIITTKTLSSGQMQKIAFIRAILNDVEILILDESTSNLDKETRELVFKILNNKKITIINSTHNEEDFNFDLHIKLTIENDGRKVLLN